MRMMMNRTRERANMSYLMFVMLFVVFAVIILTELLVLERTPADRMARTLPETSNEVQSWLTHQVISYPVPSDNPPDALWQPVTNTRHKFFVYSAYEEKRTIPAIRVIGVTKTRGADKAWCRVWLANNQTLTLRGRVKPIRENWNRPYSACFILCSLQQHPGISLKDAKVSVIASPEAVPSNILQVLSTDWEEKRGKQMQLTVCVKPLHFSYEHAVWLIEWLELNMLLGVNKFILYIKSVSKPVQCLLSHYEKLGVVKLLPWKLAFTSKLEIRNHGQFAAFNDCLYRSMSSTDWLINIDIDEVIIPRNGIRNLTTLMAVLNRVPRRPKSAAFLFQNAFFYTLWEDDPSAKDSPLVTMRKTRRWAVPHAVKNRSKYVVTPRGAVELGNHFIWEFASGNIAVAAPQELALLHHYRMACEYGGHECLKVKSQVDQSAQVFGKELENRVNKKHIELQKTCNLPSRMLNNNVSN